MLADEPREMSEMNEGNIAVVAGLKHTVTGDVITLPSKSSKTEFLSKLQFKTLHIPQPMFFCSIEPESASYQKDLDYALSCLSREDPSLRVSVDDETGQTMLSGMGELHLEIIIDRIRQEYKVPAELGKLQVAYRETPTIPITLSDSLVRTYGNHTHSVTMDITVEPSHDVIEPQLVYSKDTINCPTNISYSDIIGAIQNGIELACQRGPVLCYPVSHVQVTVHHVQVNQGTSLPVVTACTTSCVSKALRESQGQLLEPLMELSITLPHEYLTVVLSDLTSLRRAQVLEIKDASDVKTLSVLVPVASLTVR
jgi:elongation factor G